MSPDQPQTDTPESSFSQLIDQLRLEDGAYSVDVGGDWLQGRTVFGGLQAALMTRAMRQLIGAEIPLRVLQTTFVAPVPAGTLHIQTQLLRRGRSAVHCEARILLEDGSIGALAVGVFGAARPSSIRIQPTLADMPDAAAGMRLPYIEDRTPAFTRHYALHWIAGEFPFSGASEARSRVLVRNRQVQPLDECHLCAYADVIPSPALALLKQPAPASSLTWTLELFADPGAFDGASDWCLDAEVTAAADGYLAQTASVYAPDGSLAALSRQSVVAFG